MAFLERDNLVVFYQSDLIREMAFLVRDNLVVFYQSDLIRETTCPVSSMS
jgi:hypothetical protein